MVKPPLNDHLHQEIIKKYGNLVNACRVHQLPYGWFRESLIANTFKMEWLEKFFPEISLDALQDQYSFRFAKSNKVNEDTFEKMVKFSKLGYLFGLIDDEDIRLIKDNQLAAEKVAEVIRTTCAQIREALR